MNRVPRQHLNRNVRRERDGRALVRQALLLGCGLLLACGFAVAARQQFAAVRYGYQSEDLRRERERLLAEQRRLLLMLEERTSPAELERAARELGLQPARSTQIGLAAATAAGGEGRTSAPRGATNSTAPTFVGSAAATALRR
ncbi:MAG TPA: hypothetical protein VGB73_04045 [Pyrinomonadaceae bacterium]|jgi:hypothetical protein